MRLSPPAKLAKVPAIARLFAAAETVNQFALATRELASIQEPRKILLAARLALVSHGVPLSVISFIQRNMISPDACLLGWQALWDLCAQYERDVDDENKPSIIISSLDELYAVVAAELALHPRFYSVRDKVMREMLHVLQIFASVPEATSNMVSHGLVASLVILLPQLPQPLDCLHALRSLARSPVSHAAFHLTNLLPAILPLLQSLDDSDENDESFAVGLLASSLLVRLFMRGGGGGNHAVGYDALTSRPQIPLKLVALLRQILDEPTKLIYGASWNPGGTAEDLSTLAASATFRPLLTQSIPVLVNGLLLRPANSNLVASTLTTLSLLTGEPQCYDTLYAFRQRLALALESSLLVVSPQAKPALAVLLDWLSSHPSPPSPRRFSLETLLSNDFARVFLCKFLSCKDILALAGSSKTVAQYLNDDGSGHSVFFRRSVVGVDSLRAAVNWLQSPLLVRTLDFALTSITLEDDDFYYLDQDALMQPTAHVMVDIARYWLGAWHPSLATQVLHLTLESQAPFDLFIFLDFYPNLTTLCVHCPVMYLDAHDVAFFLAKCTKLEFLCLDCFHEELPEHIVAAFASSTSLQQLAVIVNGFDELALWLEQTWPVLTVLHVFHQRGILWRGSDQEDLGAFVRRLPTPSPSLRKLVMYGPATTPHVLQVWQTHSPLLVEYGGTRHQWI